MRTLHHEYFHAALDSAVAAGRAPAWLNEGLAQYFENLAVGKAGLSPGEGRYLGKASRTDRWLPIEALSTPSFSHLEGDQAGLAYLQAYAMVDRLIHNGGERRMRTFIRKFVRGENVGRLLKREYRLDLDAFEAAVRTDY